MGRLFLVARHLDVSHGPLGRIQNTEEWKISGDAMRSEVERDLYPLLSHTSRTSLTVVVGERERKKKTRKTRQGIRNWGVRAPDIGCLEWPSVQAHKKRHSNPWAVAEMYYQNSCQSRFSGVHLVSEVFQEKGDSRECWQFPISFYKRVSRFWGASDARAARFCFCRVRINMPLLTRHSSMSHM